MYLSHSSRKLLSSYLVDEFLSQQAESAVVIKECVTSK